MPIIESEIFINAPIHECSDLARNVDIHIQTSSKTKERVVGGVASGLLEAGDTVTWEAVHFGFRQRLTVQVVSMDRPYMFVDVMVKGAFHSFTHTHEFMVRPHGTLMIDRFQYKSPLGLIGMLADKLFLERYMAAFIISRGKFLKEIAEKASLA